METKTVDKILGNVEVEALAHTSPDTLSQVVAKTIVRRCLTRCTTVLQR